MGRPRVEGPVRDTQINVLTTKEMRIQLDKIASIDGVPVSRIIEVLMKRYIEERESDIQKYDEFITSIRDKRNSAEG